MVKRYVLKSCCGKQSYLFHTEKPVKKEHLKALKEAGFTTPQSFQEYGIFYIRGKNLVATCPFGTNRINVKAWGADASAILNEFAAIIDNITSGN